MFCVPFFIGAEGGEVNSAGRAGSGRPTRTLTSRVYSLTDPTEVTRKETSELRTRNVYIILWTNVLGRD